MMRNFHAVAEQLYHLRETMAQNNIAEPIEVARTANDTIDFIENELRKPMGPKVYIRSLCEALYIAEEHNTSVAEEINSAINSLEALTVKVVVCEPGKLAKITSVSACLDSYQKLVGGYIEPFYLMNEKGEEDAVIICNEEGKLNGMKLNRAVYQDPVEEEFTYQELKKYFRTIEQNGEHDEAYIVFTEDSFSEPYPLEARTYKVSSNNKAFLPNMGGYSIFGGSIDGTDPCVRLERYMAAEHGGKNGWKVERCYTKAEKQMTEIIAGPFFIIGVGDEDFVSLTDEQAEKYVNKFKCPEMFYKENGDIKAQPYLPSLSEKER